MDHQKIIQLRHQAADARELREKACIRPDDLDALLDLALAQIEERQDRSADPLAALDVEPMGKFGHGWRRRAERPEKERDDARLEVLGLRAEVKEIKKERDENGAMLSLVRDALAGTEAQLDAYKARLKKSEEGREVLAERVRDFADSIRREQDTNDRLRAEQHRPLTPDDITDEMVERAAHCLAMDDSPSLYSGHPDGTAAKFRALALETLLAAATEPPARPEGAEEIQSALVNATNAEALELDALDASKDAYRALSDSLAARGVRVVGSES